MFRALQQWINFTPTPGRVLALPPAQPQGFTRSEFRLQTVRAALLQEAASTRDPNRGQRQEAPRTTSAEILLFPLRRIRGIVEGLDSHGREYP